MVISNKVRIWLFYVLTLFFWFANYAYVPYLSAYATTMTPNAALVGVMLGSYGWAQLTLRIPIGILSDRYNNRRVFIRVGCLAGIIAAIGLYWSPSVGWLILFRTMSGVSVSVWVAMSVLFNSYFDPKESVRAMTLLNAFNLMGQMLASLFAMPVTKAHGIRSAFLLAAMAAVIPMVISLTLKDKAVSKKPLAFGTLLAVGKTRWVLAVSLMAIISQTMSFATTSGFTPQIALRLGAQPSFLAFIQLAATLGGALFSLLSARTFVSRFGARNSLVVLLAIQAVTCGLQPLAPSWSVLLIIVFLNGIARGTSLSLMLGLVVLPFPYEKQAAAMGFYQALYSLGITLGPTLAGFVMQSNGLDAGFYVITLIGLAAPVIGITLLSDERKELPTFK